LEVNLLTLDSISIQTQNITTSSFDLYWDGVDNAADYEIFISLENNSVDDLSTDTTFVLSDTSLSFSAPNPFETYYVFGRPISAAGDKPNYSNSISIQLESLGTPVPPIVSNISSNRFDLSWDAVEGANLYQVYIGLDSDSSLIGENDSLFTVPSENMSYLVPEYSEQYFYNVRAIANSGDTSNYSTTSTIKLPVAAYLEQDSLGMVALYENANGESWANAQNWLTGKLNTWEGLSMINDSLKSINLPSNQIEGMLPTEMGDLNFVNEINFAENNLSNISTLSTLLNSLNSFDVSGNALSFEDLQAFNAIANFSYGNQEFNYSLPSEYLEFLSADISIGVTAPASSNTFQWYKDSELLEGETNSELLLSNLERADEGLFYVEVRNDLLGDLTLTSNVTELKVSSLERDVQALREFYESTNGNEWGAISWNTTSNDPREWSSNNQDIVVEDDRVVEINLPENNLTGSIPEILNEVLGLRSVDVSNNAIEDLPNLTSLPNLSLLNVSGNALDYLDLEPNISVTGFVFNDQASFGNEPDQRLLQGAGFSLSYDVAGTSNTYEWFRNDELVAETDSAYISIDSLTYDNMGNYRLEVGNEVISAVDPEFRIGSNSVQIIATSSMTGVVQDANEFATESGRVYLFGYQEGEEFDSVRLENGQFFVNIQSGGVFEFQNIELDDYLLYVKNDGENYPDLLNSYFPNTIDWELAEVVSLREDTEGLEIIMEGEPQEPEGTSLFSGYLDEEYEVGERVLPRRRVSGAGVSVRRVSVSNKDITFRSILENGELVAFLETDENGEFEIPNLTAGNYTVKFDIPGVPMNEQSDINFDLTGEDQEALEISALIDGGQISVTRVKYTANKSALMKNVTVYPNPSNGEFKIMGSEAITNIKIISTEGRLIEEITDFHSISEEVNIDIGNYPNGMYFLQIIWNDGLRSTNKLLKK
jgi:Leucine-rich repeat (LRR) protein